MLLAACDRFVPSPAERYDAWRKAGHVRAADAYAAHLREAGVADVVPMQELLRSGRHWRSCDASEFVVPPREAWDRMIPTLRLVRELRHRGLLEDAQVGSVYRDAEFNRCEGGSTRSQHLRNSALDFDLPEDSTRVARLCAFWRASGAASRFGLGLYDDRHIHVDTAGHRTWGGDYSGRSSPCR